MEYSLERTAALAHAHAPDFPAGERLPERNVDRGDTFREHVFNFAKHRRPEHYGLIVERSGAGAPLPHDND